MSRRTAAGHRRGAAVAAALALLVVAVVVRAATLTPPRLVAHVAAADVVRLGGRAPRPAWPAAGEAALDVEGVGSLGASGGRVPRPTASLAKVMTAYLVLRSDPLGPSAGGGFTLRVTAADARAEAADAAQDESVVPVRAGERLDERELLEALLIPSGDNIARMLAAREAGSVPRFVALMNRAARALGMRHTTYTDPSGFAASTVSDAADQLVVFERALRFALFRRIVSTASVTLPVAGRVENYDPLVTDGYPGKTGSDSAAGGCLAFFTHVTAGGRRLTAAGVVLGQGVGSDTSVILGAAADAAQRLVSSVAPSLRVRTVIAAHTTVLVAGGSAQGRRVRARTVAPLTVIGWGGLRERVAISPAALGRSLRAGARVGEASLAGTLPTASGRPVRTAVRASAGLAAPGIGWRLAHLL